jgi:hypothetical protein
MIQLRNGRFIWIDLRIELQYAAGLPFLVENRPPPPRPTSPRERKQRPPKANGFAHVEVLITKEPGFYGGGAG